MYKPASHETIQALLHVLWRVTSTKKGESDKVTDTEHLIAISRSMADHDAPNVVSQLQPFV